MTSTDTADIQTMAETAVDEGAEAPPEVSEAGDEPAPALPPPPPIELAELKAVPFDDLKTRARSLGVTDVGQVLRPQLILAILEAQAAKGGQIHTEGVLEVHPEGYGFLRSREESYLAGSDDIYVGQNLIRRFRLRRGDTLRGPVRPPRNKERFFALVKIESVNGLPPEHGRTRTEFDDLTPLYPDRRIQLEYDPADLSTRIMDLLAPLGMGQRGLIVAPPRAGKTMLLTSIAHAIEKNHPEVILIVLLIDERPEEVTSLRRAIRGEVVASTFDDKPHRHVQVSDMVLEKAKRLVEAGNHVVILLDSITRLARAHNIVCAGSGRLMSGGLDTNALTRPRKFFGSARNVEEGGSLTVLATALIDTGSRMDEVIFEEFKGTGNLEVYLDRDLADRRIFPAIDMHASGTRKEELLVDQDDLNRIWILRRVLSEASPAEAMQLLIEKISKTPNNRAFLESMTMG